MALGNDRYFDPGAMGFALTLAGVAPPQVRSGCEIGVGGLSAAVAAATRPGTAWRAAFADAGQAETVGKLAARAGLNLEVEAGIEAFCARDDLPEFDYIGVTSNWTVLGAEAQAAVLGLARRRLRPGGVLSASYLVQPGAGQDTALCLLGRTLLRGATPADPDFSARFTEMLDEVEAVLGAAPMILTRHTDYLAQVAALRAAPDAASAWRRWFDPAAAPTTFLDVAAQMQAAGLRFGASAELANHVAEINFTPRQRKCLATLKDAETREQIADLISYTWSRVDFWVKGDAALDAGARRAALGDTRLILAGDPAAFDYRVHGMLGHVSLRREVYGPILERLAAEPAIRLADLPGEIEAAAEAAALLVAAGMARVVGETVEASVDTRHRFNRELFLEASAGRPAAVCAGVPGGVDVNPDVLRMMAAWTEGARDVQSLAARCGEMEGAKNGRDSLRISRDARAFLDDLARYQRLGVLPVEA